MKKILAMIMALMLVFSLTASVVVLADEATEVQQQELSEEEMQALMEQLEAAENTEAVEQTAPVMPEGYDESSIEQYLVYNVTDLENITLESYMIATDATLDYYVDMYASYGQPIEETEYEGKRALLMSQSITTADQLLETSNIVYLKEEGLFADKNIFVCICGTMLDSGLEEGSVVATVIMVSGNKSEVHEMVVGQQNSFMMTQNVINWINVIIALMVLIVIILIAVIVVVLIIGSKKKKVKEDNENSEFVNEEDIFDTLVSETEDIEALEEISDDVVEDIEESTEEVVEEISEEDK